MRGYANSFFGCLGEPLPERLNPPEAPDYDKNGEDYLKYVEDYFTAKKDEGRNDE